MASSYLIRCSLAMRLRSKLRSSTNSTKVRIDKYTFKELHLDAIGHLLRDLMGDGWMLFVLRAGAALALHGATRSIFTTRIKLLSA
jgi:hypothetical protein